MSATALATSGNVYSTRMGSDVVAHTYPFQFNTSGISSGIKLDTLKASATYPVDVEISCQVITAFNAATTNVVTAGTSTTATEWLNANDVAEGTTGFYPAQRLAGHEWFLDVATATTTDGITQYDLTGGAGSATVTALKPIHPRNVKLTITDANVGISAYSITVAGTGPSGNAATETFTFADGLTPAGSVIFSTISTVTINSITGAGAGDTLDMGFGVKIGLATTGTGLTVNSVIAAGTKEAASAVDATNNSVTFTTAPNGTRDFEVLYAYNAPIGGTPKRFRLTADTDIYVKYTQTGTAATTGSGILVVKEYSENPKAIV